ncbi:MAG: phosphohydrolase [bacterium]|nr:phosphohydrolase [bacterium]
MGAARPRAWTRLPSGLRLDLINPSSEDWLDSDLAIRLSRTYRWGGESAWTEPLSVAQHCLTVLALRREWSNSPLTPEEALHELLHDAEEGFIGFDCISPLKGVLGQPFKDVSDRLMSAICTRYDLPAWRPDIHLIHKRADLIAAASEAVHCAGWTHHEVRDVLGIMHPILVVDPLVKIYDCAPWSPWPSNLAAERFLGELSFLLKLRCEEESHQNTNFTYGCS